MIFAAHVMGLSVLLVTVSWSLVGRGVPPGDIVLIIVGSLAMVIAGSALCVMALVAWEWREDRPRRRSYNDALLDSVGEFLLGRHLPRAWYSLENAPVRQRRDYLSLTANRRRLLGAAGLAILAVPLSEFLADQWSVLLPILPLAVAGYLALSVSRRGGHTGLPRCRRRRPALTGLCCGHRRRAGRHFR